MTCIKYKSELEKVFSHMGLHRCESLWKGAHCTKYQLQ